MQRTAFVILLILAILQQFTLELHKRTCYDRHLSTLKQLNLNVDNQLHMAEFMHILSTNQLDLGNTLSNHLRPGASYFLPLPKGEGWGEGKGNEQIPNRPTNLHQL